MQAWKILLSRLLISLLPMMLMDIAGTEATQKAKKSASKVESSPIVGESDESDAAPADEDNDDVAADEAPPKNSPPAKGKSKGKETKNVKKADREDKKSKKDAKIRQKLMEGFRQAEEFHNSWYNLPTNKVSAALKNLTDFCKVACTKSQCMDEEVANNCHLICPKSTTKLCPDPLKQSDDEGPDAEEVLPGEGNSDPSVYLDDSSMQGNMSALDSPSVADSISQADKDLLKGGGEGG